MPPLCRACQLGNAPVAGALLDGGADIDFATPPGSRLPGWGVIENKHSTTDWGQGPRASASRLLITRGSISVSPYIL